MSTLMEHEAILGTDAIRRELFIVLLRCGEVRCDNVMRLWLEVRELMPALSRMHVCTACGRTTLRAATALEVAIYKLGGAAALGAARCG